MHPAYTQLTEHTAALLGLTVAEIDFDSSLLLQGMESIGLMRTVNLLRKQGVACSFDTLKKHPTLNSWLAMLDDAGNPPSLEGGLPASDMSKPFALTPVQQAYWMGRQEDQPLGGNSCQVYMEFQCADLCPERLALACNRLIERHPMLRAQFTDQGEQHVPANLRTFKLSVDDLRTHSAEQIAVRLNQHRDDYSHYCADINEGWPLRVALSRLPRKSSRLHLNLDLLVADVLSIRILLRDLAYYYQRDAPELAPFTANFSQYLQRHELESDKRRCTAQDYWKQRLHFLPGAPTLPLAQQPEKLTKPRFTRRDYLVKNPQLAALETKAKKQGVTLATVFLTLYCEVLARWSENKHFLLNIPLFNRHELVPAVSDMVADFTSLLLLEVDFRRPASFTERLQQLQSQLHRDITHADYSGVEVLRDLARADGTAPRSAPVVFALNLGKPFVPDEAEKTLGQLGWMISQTPQVWIDHQSYPTREGLILNWDSVDALFPAGMVSALFNSWLARLHLLIEQEWDLLPEMGLLPETQATRSHINATTESLPQAQLHDGFFAQARRQPDAPAIFTAEGCLSYQELSQYALQMAHRLQQLGVKPQDRVAINLPKGGEQIAAVLAVLAAGASWVPLAMHHPLARRALICQRAEVVCVITQLSEIWPETIAVYDLQQHGFNASSESLPAPLPGEGESLAYIIYTSGSTGEPKGVAVTHRAAWNTIATLNHRFDINRDDRVLALSGLEFDLSVYDIFGLLSAGGAIVMPREDERRDPDTWRRLSQQNRVTLWNSVPALMEMLLLTNSETPFLPHLRLVWVSGDWVAPDLAQRLRHKLLQAVRIVAMGGATEAAIWSNAFEITPDFDVRERVPYGYPLSNQQFRVMDECEYDCPDWVPGELWIGGEGLARGYVGDLQQTAQSIASQLDRAAVLQLAQGIEEVSLLAMAQALLSLPQFASARKARVALTDLVSSGAVASRHERLIGRWLHALTEQGFLQQVDEERFVAQRQVTSHDVEQRWQTLHQLGHKVNWGAAILRYMHDSHLALPALMRNEADPLDLLFPEGQTHVAEAAYRDNLVSRTVNELVCATICQIAREKNGETLRLLEVGAGVGGTSLDLIPALAAFPVDYLFSDLSNYFLNEAEKRFSQWPWVRYGLYDINQPALPQGIEPASRDVILCANVLHNSRHAADVIAKLKEILAPGGWLVFIEATSNSYQIMSSMEFKDGLTGFEDCRLEQGTTFISVNEWHHYLEQAGAMEIVIAPQEALALNDLGQHVFAARFKTHQAIVHPDELRHHLSQWLPGWMLPDEIHQLDHLPLTSNGKIDRRALASLIPTKRTERSTTAAAPASALEKDIAKIWQSVLKIDSVGRHDNFFTLGGDSLLVAQVVSRLRATLPQASGWRWDTLLRAMMNEKDLAALAQRFSQPQASHYTLQEIQPGEASATTLLLVHDGSGTLAPYRAMLEKIDKRQRVLGLALNTPEQFLAQPAESGIAQLAKQAVEVIDQDMNSAPLHIVGYCLGGMLAQEIASLLHATGKEIAQLSIISSYPVPFRIDDDLLAEYIFARVVQADPRALGYPDDEQAFQHLINDILQETPGVIPQGSLAAFSLGKQDAGSQAITALASRSPDTRLEAIRRHCALGDSDLNTPARVAEQFKLIRHSLLAVNGHPLQAYDHPVTFLRQLGEMQVLPGMNTEMTTFWQQHTTLPLHIHDIPGDHFSCLNSKNCHYILNALALSAGEHND